MGHYFLDTSNNKIGICYFAGAISLKRSYILFSLPYVRICFYRMPNKSWPILCSSLLYEMGQDFLDT